MFPYRFDQSSASTPTPAPAAPTPTPTRSKRRLGTAALLIAALSGGAVGGGAVGAVAATYWIAPQTSAAPQTPPAASPAPNNASAPSMATVANSAVAPNIAGSVFSKVSPAVVRITVSGGISAYTAEGSGSGFVVDAKGLILTNNHVVENARVVSVKFNSGETREAQVLGTDRGNDLALLKVDLPENVPVAALGDSEQVQVGETAIAIGSPFGLDQTVTQGIISAIHRNWNPGNGRTQRNLLQTDAPINPGNSGGPLLNARGEVIGINTMIESPVRGSVGVGFAVPINTAKQRLSQLEAGANLEPVWLGISGQELDETIAKDQSLSVSEGVLVVGIVPGSPADQAGLRGGQSINERIPRGGDVITAIDGKAVTNVDEISARLADKKPGDTVTLTVVRDGQEQQLDVTLQAWPRQAG